MKEGRSPPSFLVSLHRGQGGSPGLPHCGFAGGGAWAAGGGGGGAWAAGGGGGVWTTGVGVGGKTFSGVGNGAVGGFKIRLARIWERPERKTDAKEKPARDATGFGFNLND